MRHLADLLHLVDGFDLVTLFGPEHGIRADAQDMIGVASETDRHTGVPVHSLYGSDPASITPTADQLAGLDDLIFDVQDVGSRYYTFAATMRHAMVAASGLLKARAISAGFAQTDPRLREACKHSHRNSLNPESDNNVRAHSTSRPAASAILPWRASASRLPQHAWRSATGTSRSTPRFQ